MKSSRPETFRVVSRKTVFRGYVTRLEVLELETPNGRKLERELIHHPGAAVVVPRQRNGRLILVRQLRIATGRHIWEFPAGTLEKGEPARRCADRELQEETGWKAGRLRKMLDFFPTPGISDEKMFLYLADDLRPVNGVNPDPDEDLVVKTFTIREVERMICRGTIIDGKTILGFLFFKCFLHAKK